MLAVVVACFIIGYLLIAFEHPLKLDKTVPALLMGAICWALVALGHLDVIDHQDKLISHTVLGEKYTDGLLDVLLHHCGKIAEILIFLMGAMTIVELVDLHQGFSVITNRITTNSKRKMLVLVCILAFFLSAVLDNLTTTIVMISLIRRLVTDRNDRLWFASMVVIAANAGGAWSPIGDVTTTMLWIGKKVSTMKLIESLFIPSVICLVIPLLIVMFRKEFRGLLPPRKLNEDGSQQKDGLMSSNIMLATGLGALIFVPIFKSVTHLPPYIGMMLGLGLTWLVSEYIHPEEDFSEERKEKYSARHALSRIEMSSILFFLGILLTISALESMAVMHGDQVMGFLHRLAEQLQSAIPNEDIVIILIGVLSAVVDNVPLVAATMGMYTNPIDSNLWHFIAYSAGTGGSMLIIGSAAGVAAMGLERIDFIWYLRNIAWIAFLGFIAGALVFIGLSSFIDFS
ncbi:MAG: sodium:proton antiporter NhaD [Saprospiraceae bacterium]|nr:sodium:proton antiporter NhaD [Saprospiraceae bacterium]